MAEEKLTAAGGWCAPSDIVAEVHEDQYGVHLTLPEVSVRRGGILFPMPGCPEHDAMMDREYARQAIVTLIARNIGDTDKAQYRVISDASIDAHGRDVHVHWPTVPVLWKWGTYRFIGIEIADHTTYRLSSIHHHHVDGDHELDFDDWED